MRTIRSFYHRLRNFSLYKFSLIEFLLSFFFSLVEHTNENLTCQKLTHVIIALLESVYVCNMESKKLFTVWHL